MTRNRYKGGWSVVEGLVVCAIVLGAVLAARDGVAIKTRELLQNGLNAIPTGGNPITVN